MIIATGAAYRRLGIPDLEDLQGRGVFYGTAASEAPAMRGKNVFIAGSGNSAGQAALHLAKWARKVTILVRAPSPAAGMSDYLIRQIGAAPNVDVYYQAQVADGTGTGTGHLQSLVLQDTDSGQRRTVPADALFVLIGAQPRTEWLGQAVARDRSGSSAPARACPPEPAGPPPGRRCHWRPACPGCSRPVTCAGNRSNGSPPRSARVPPPSPWYTAPWHSRRGPQIRTGQHTRRGSQPAHRDSAGGLKTMRRPPSAASPPLNKSGDRK